jgi:hypothetical protein
MRLFPCLLPLLLWAAPMPASTQLPNVEAYPIVRAQLRAKVCNVANAGTDNDVRVKLNSVNSTWLDYGRNDFGRGDDFTYDVKLDGLLSFADVTQLRISKTGTDGLCLKEVALLLNGANVFSKKYSNGRWLDGSSAVLTFNSAELRGSSWAAYQPPLSPDFSFSNGELESRIETVVGDALRAKGAEQVHWGDITGEAVRVSWRDAQSAVVDLDLRANIEHWPDQTVDVDFRLILSCMLGEPHLRVSNYHVNVVKGRFTSAATWVAKKLQNMGMEAVAVSIALNPALGAITTLATFVAERIEIPTSGGPAPNMNVTFPPAPLCPADYRFEKGTFQDFAYRSSLRYAYSATQVMQIAKSLSCVAPPATDASAPKASLIVEYRQRNGLFSRTIVKIGDPAVTIVTDKNADIGVTYIGEDDQGLRTVWLDYDMKWFTATGIVTPTLVAINTTSPCPKQVIIATKRFPGSNNPGEYKFASRASNWTGGSARTANVIVQIK